MRFLALFFVLLGVTLPFAHAEVPTDYNVVWTSPSADSLDSMPLSGSRGAGANVWVQDGSLWLYLAHNSAYDSQGRLLKLGCLRLTPPGGGFDAATFRQELDLARGQILVSGVNAKGEKTAVTFWFAGETLLIESSDDLPGVWEIHYATWRDVPRDKLNLDMWASHSLPADTVDAQPDHLLWFQRNADHDPLLPRRAEAQGLPADQAFDTTSRRIFGGALAAAGGLTFVGSEPAAWQDWPGGRRWTYHTAPRTPLVLAVALRAAEDMDPAAWPAEARALLDRTTRHSARRAEAARWKEFWTRSSIVINRDRGPADPAWQVGRNHALFRYMLACNQGGEFPLLFNGGIFTTDNPPGRITGNNNSELPVRPASPLSPDFRRWMFCGFMSQNQRWLAWPALAAGDADLVEPSIRFYRDRSRIAAVRARLNHAEGVVYTEPLDIWGLCATGDRPDGLCGHQHLTYHFAMMLEHALIALHTRTYSGADLAPDLDWIIGTLRFFDSFYRAQHKQRHGSELNTFGRLVIYPGSAVEAVTGATNPIDAVSGLLAVSDALLALPDSVLSAERRATVAAFRATLPDLPVGERDGRRSLLIADSYEQTYNAWEFPEMYAAWPYRRVGVTVPGTLELARTTLDTIQKPWADKVLHHDFSWMPNIVNAASAGRTDRAAALLVDKMSDRKAQVRFPAFFGPGHDWLPDHNWGGSGTTGLQEMLLQPDAAGEKLHLLPAWPRDWDVEFKLHAPRATTIELTYRDGKIERLDVTPASRRADLVLPKDLKP
jgi:hypothetical protein